ncbi:hydrogenase nickel incorporation protein HypB [Aestuariirhabdus litorea]|uniref:Hydrogenase maturation factor HypB n=1 Tax=Aestuariirhabdus litorea TaxID=2528527 RepID=A0A3P3VLQ2_9GAMM|nr:hydrogenase nickel incorporation protein HypB [Aestuariirhabdus litorea]RRJ83665.1 hydrogenase nickel incorporation protein HypB [Aestuariirhabdus litorea]RWW96887.1 hydrogenase nickel incorporation protein HypB [Endozoicomonadaceae bacterium GTF-13]
MCTTCGCASGETRVEGADLHPHQESHSHAHHSHAGHHHHGPDGHSHSHSHSHARIAPKAHPVGGETPFTPADNGRDLHYGKGAAHAHAPGLSQSRMVQIEQDILGKNDRYAAINRARLQGQSLLSINLVSSPGSGKTTLLTRTIEDLRERCAIAVIEGDQQTANDAERIRATGASAVQINTGKGCHLDAHMVGHALDKLELEALDLLMIENVGNLVCPAAFDLGEAHRVAILSVTEGEDKPVKYPDMFSGAELMLLNKVDLLPHLNFDVEACIASARKVNPAIEVIQCSATSGEGMSAWYQWIAERQQAMIQREIDALEARLGGLKQKQQKLSL